MTYEEFARCEERLRTLALRLIKLKGVGGKLALSIAHQILAMSNEERKSLAAAIVRGIDE